MQYQDYYKTLGVSETASEADIKKAFRKLAKQYHPDMHPNDKKAEEQFKKVNEAYEVLGNAQRRKEYDELRKNIGNGDQMNFDPSKYGYGQAQGRGFGGFEGFGGSTVFTGGESGFSDFFEMLFGRGRGMGNMGSADIFSSGRQYSTDMRGQDVEATVELTVEEAFHGAKKRIALETGGKRITIEFTIPAGTMEGERIRLAGQGEPGTGKGGSGDLLMAAKFHGGKYTLNGLDLTTDIKLAPWEAALGAKTAFQTIDGEIVVKVPPGVQTGSRIRIAGKGYKNRQGQRGDLYLTVRIVNPPSLSEEEKKLYQELAKVSRFHGGR